MRDWLRAFRPASFRGVAFQVDTEATDGGRRVAISPIAYSDIHVTEDMGGAVARFTLTAYVVGDAFDAAARSLSAALNAPGPATLVLPMGGPQLVRVPRWSLSRELYRAGYVGFDIEFVAAGRASAPFAAVPGGIAIAGLISAGIALLSNAVASRTRNEQPGQADNLATASSAAAAIVEAVALSSIVSVTASLTIADHVADIRLAASSAATEAPVIAETIATAVSLVADSGEPFHAVPALQEAISLMASDPVSLATAAVLAAAWCQALVSVEYLSRQDARHARDLISPTVDPVIEALSSGLDSETAEWLSGIAAVAAQSLSDIAANRAPLVRIETGISAPSTLLAYQLYSDAGRAAELTARNAVATPALMPVAFEAVSP